MLNELYNIYIDILETSLKAKQFMCNNNTLNELSHY